MDKLSYYFLLKSNIKGYTGYLSDALKYAPTDTWIDDCKLTSDYVVKESSLDKALQRAKRKVDRLNNKTQFHWIIDKKVEIRRLINNEVVSKIEELN